MSSTTLQSDFVARAQGYSCPARLLLTSFRQQRNFTHYTYRLLLWVPIDTSMECVTILKQITLRSSQEVYERDFRSAVRHDFVFRMEDIDVFQTSDSNNKRNQPATSALDGNSNRASIRSSLEAMNLGSKNSQSPPLSSCRDTQNLVTQSYIQAQSSNAISFTQIPQEVTVNGLGVGR
ncbi:hypothetical protein GX50_02179 [[Emmonsia] crescens]|uniref:Uncharacterized protein n=1 Tax=[Emmonsia] crescens TaxID=73230 RepID=A0A2B7ZNI3_9EURO|nr:hypothetical protein GX50_02179 [Emmonsia crescens]